jgi:hypothetical protein
MKNALSAVAQRSATLPVPSVDGIHRIQFFCEAREGGNP